MLVDDRREGDVGDDRLLGINETRDIGGDYNPNFSYWTVNIYVNDATFYNLYIGVDGRKVEVQSLESTSYSVPACQPFDLSWSTDYSGATTLFWDGVVGTGSEDEPHDYSGYTFATCTPGQAYFTIKADNGPAGNGGGRSDEKSIIVDIIASPTPPPGPNPNPSPNPSPNPTPPPSPNPTPNPTPPPGPNPNPSPNPSPNPTPPPSGTGCTDDASTTFLSGIPATLTPGQTVSYTVRVTDTGNTRWYHGNAYRFIQQTGLSIVSTAPSNVAGQNYGHLPAGVYPNDYVDWTFDLTAPATPGNYTLNMRMMHRAANEYIKPDGSICAAPNADFYFGQTLTANFSVSGSGNQPPTVVLDYPANGSSVSGTVSIDGWALDNASAAEGHIVRVEIMIDGSIINSNSYGNKNRADVCAIFPGRAGCPNVGYLYSWNSNSVSNGPHTVSVRAIDNSGLSAVASASITVSNIGRIIVTSNHALGSWIITGPSNISGSGNGVFTYTSRPSGNYILSPGNLGGYSVTITPSTSGTLNPGSDLTFNLTYTPLIGNVTVNANISAGSWVIRDAVGNQVGTGAGNSPVPYSFTVGTYRVTANPVSGYNLPTPNPRNMIVAPGNNQPVVLDYNLTPLNAPTITSLNNSACESVRITWQDNSDNEQGFTVWRRGQAGSYSQISPSLPANSTSFMDSSGLPNQTYFYVVRAFSNIPFYRESASGETGPVLYIQCRPNMQTDKIISRIIKAPFPPGTSQPFSNSSIIEDDDVLRFQITISNTGTAPGNVTSVTDVLSNNLKPACASSGACFTGSVSNPWNLRIDKDNDGVYNELSTAYGREAGTVTGVAPNLSISIPGGWGSKQVGNPNWIIFVDALVQSVLSESHDTISNTACVSFTYPGNTDTACDTIGPILFKTGIPKVPDFREVSP
jgi:uncharacterized repeat protein (TIGR01451 family)